jgi:hypothetical protein
MKITLEVEIGEDYKEVDFEGDPEYGNLGIGPYEFWGFKGNDVLMGWEIDGISWDKSKYTDKENQAIDKFVDKNIRKIEDLLILEAEEIRTDYSPD